MRIPRIEAITLRATIKRTQADDWIRTQLGEPTIGTCFTVGIALAELETLPSDLKIVVLKYTLNQLESLEDKRAIIQKAKDALAPGGAVVAVSRVCDNGQELAERMVRDGIPADKLGISNLTNREVGILRPNFAELICGSVSIRRRLDNATSEDVESRNMRDMATVENIRMSPTDLIIVDPAKRFSFKIEESFTVRTTDIGMVWEK